MSAEVVAQEPDRETPKGVSALTLTESYVDTFERPEPLPALGDETPTKVDNSHRELPPPPAPSQSRIDEIAMEVTPLPVGIGAPASNRQVWGQMAAQPQAQDLIRNAEKALDEPIQPLTEELWMLFEQTGDRVTYQDAVCSRYNRLRDLALGEALEYEGRFLPAIEETLTAILDQGAWSVPAHGKDLDVFRGNRYVVDLASSQLSWTLATVDYWLADELPTPLRVRIKEEVKRRVLNPYLNAIRTGRPIWWMIRPNNWTAVCGGAITGAGLTLETDPMVRAEFIADAEVILGRYIDSFSDEGVSEEGVGYWTYGFSHYLYASEAIRRSTDGAIDLLADEKVFRVSQAPVSLELEGGVYGAFGDQSVSGKPDARLVRFAAMRYGLSDGDAEAFGQIEKGASHSLGPHLYSLIVRSFGSDAPSVNGFNALLSQHDDPAYRSWFPESELYISRPGDFDGDAMSVAIRASNNGESHNHNDVGSYVIVYKGVPVLLDPGMERYTGKSFSKYRYDVSLNNSYGHAVPLVANRMQKIGTDAYGEVVDAVASDTVDSVTIDMTPAYRSPGLVALTRELSYERPDGDSSGTVTIIDCVSNDSPEAFSTALVSKGTFTILSENIVKVTYRGVSLYAIIDTRGQAFALSEDNVTGFYQPDKRLARRLGIYLREPVLEGCITVTISTDDPTNTFDGQP